MWMLPQVNVCICVILEQQRIIENQEKNIPSEGLQNKLLEEFNSYDLDESKHHDY